MTTAPATKPVPAKLRLSDEAMAAWLKTGPDGIDPGALLARLGEAGVVLDDALKQHIAGLAGEDGRIHAEEEMIVCKGTPAEDDQPAHFEQRRADAAPTEGKAQSHYDRNRLALAKAGDVIAALLPGVPGKDGRNLRGEAVPRRKAGREPILGSNVQWDADGKTVRATADGSVSCDGEKVSVETVLELTCGVDFNTGNIDFGGDVILHGGIADLFRVTGRRIDVAGTIEAAEVRAERDLVVAGGIVGKEKGRIRAGGHLSARFITNTDVECGGNLTVQTELANCQVRCTGKIDLERGAILGGHVAANGGIHCVTLGSPAQVNTLVEVGSDPVLLADFSQRLGAIETALARIKKTRSLVEPLMRNPKALSAQQKEKATELLFEADEAEKKIRQETLDLKAKADASRSCADATISVVQLVHPGVTLRFADVETTTKATMRGPIDFFAQTINGERTVCSRTHSGRTNPLDSRPRRNDLLMTFNRILKEMSEQSAG